MSRRSRGAPKLPLNESLPSTSEGIASKPAPRIPVVQQEKESKPDRRITTPKDRRNKKWINIKGFSSLPMSELKVTKPTPEGPPAHPNSVEEPAETRREWRKSLPRSLSSTNLTPPFSPWEISKESEVVQEKNQSAQLGLPRCVRGLEPGNPKGKFEFAMKYYKGDKNTPVNKEEAVRMFKKSAKKGHGPSQEALANCYDKGEGTPQDFKKAMKWSLRAAEKGNADAQYRLASYYHHGRVVPPDPIEAKKLYLKAAKQGHFMALVKLKTYYPFDEKYENEKQAVIWLQTAAEEGSKEANTLLQELQKTIEDREPKG